MKKPAKRKEKRQPVWLDLLENAVLRGVIVALLALPYRWRVPVAGRLVSRIIAPLVGYNRRAMANLAFIHPNMPDSRRREIARAATDNMGRTLIENYSTRKFLARNADTPISGPGLAALEGAQKDGRPVILVSGHFGNYEAPRAALVGRGYEVGGLYRPARNPYFDRHYKQTMLAFGGPVFAQGRAGTSGFVRHLRSGGMLVLLFDQYVARGLELPFLGQPAPTAPSAAQLALRYDALLIPFYGTRQENGLDFKIELEAPIAHSTVEDMIRAMTTSLEARIEDNPGQWLWVHRRWKPERLARRQRKRAAAKIGPGPIA